MKIKNIKKTLFIFLVSSFLVLVIIPGTRAIFSEKETATINLNVDTPKYTVTFDANGGIASFASKDIAYGHEYGELPTAEKCGSTFLGWYTGLDNGVKIEEDSIFDVANEQTLYARYESNGVLYDVLKCEAERTDILEVNKLAKKYTGEHQDSMDETKSTEDIYHWYGSNNVNGALVPEKNNVIFADQCWQILRTTDTGGVKLIYNGEANDGKCLRSREKHVGYSGTNTLNLLGSYYYGTDYTYDNETNEFKLSGEVNSIEVTSENASLVIPELYGKYTCMSNSQEVGCSNFYIIDNYYNTTKANVFKLLKNYEYSIFGALNYYEGSDITNAGYMKNADYSKYNKYIGYTYIRNGVNSITGYSYYSDEIDYGNITPGKYTLINPQPISELNDYSVLNGKYISSDTGDVYSVYYVLKVEGTLVSYNILSGGNLAISIKLGDSYIDNNGVYDIINADGSPTNELTFSEVITGFPNNSLLFNGKYGCFLQNGMCINLLHISGISSEGFSSYSINDSIIFSEDIEYINGKYYLTGDMQTVWDLLVDEEVKKINTHHYSCPNASQTICSSVYYYYLYFSDSLFGYELNGGELFDIAFSKMLYLDNDDYHINTKSSNLKRGIDLWYKKYIYDDYDSYVEDTIYCNDRSMINMGGFNKVDGDITTIPTFSSKSNNNLSCKNETDRFSTLNDKAKLTYKVGLSSLSELNIMNSKEIYKSNSPYWLLTPYSYTYEVYLYLVELLGDIYTLNTYNARGVRPVISLIPDIRYTKGTGKTDDPYIIDTSGD